MHTLLDLRGSIPRFVDITGGAVHCQIWIAIFTYLLSAIAKNKPDLAINLYTLAQTMGLTLLEKAPICMSEMFYRT